MLSSHGFLAIAALLLWIPASIVAFFVVPPTRAALLSIFGGLLFLPELVWLKFPSLPYFTKQSLPYVCVLLSVILNCPSRFRNMPRERWATLLSLMLVLGGIGIWQTNQDSLQYGKSWHLTVLPGLLLRDGMYISLSDGLDVAMPFLVGRLVVQNSKHLEELFVTIVGFALVYSLFALFEMRMSPNLHYWIYGHQAHTGFGQTIRWGGYRPMVFMGHGLAVAMFFVVAVFAATTLMKIRVSALSFVPPRAAALYLTVILVACKSTGALVYAMALLPLLIFCRVRTQLRVAMVLAIIVFTYPVMRATDTFPTNELLAASQRLAGSDREQSLGFRFHNEDSLLAKARERPYFGWGKFDRNAVFDEDGYNTSTTDGAWIITFGQSGSWGFLTAYGLLLIPVLLAARRFRNIPDPSDRLMFGSLGLMVGTAAIDLIPNALFANYPYFLSGALLTLSRSLSTPDDSTLDSTPPPSSIEGLDERNSASSLPPTTMEPIRPERLPSE